MERIERGDAAEAGEEFVRLWTVAQRKVFLSIFALVHNLADAEEILQQTSVVLWRKFSEYRRDQDFTRWACGVARYEVLKHRQAKGKAALPISEELLERLSTSAIRELDSLDRRREALQQCLEELLPQHRELIRMRYQEDCRPERLAARLGRTADAIRRALHRIRMRLLECMDRKLAEERT